MDKKARAKRIARATRLAVETLEPRVVLYLEQPPAAAQLRAILRKLGMGARELLRKGEAEYAELNLADASRSEASLIEAMAQHPRLIERPIVVKGERPKK